MSEDVDYGINYSTDIRPNSKREYKFIKDIISIEKNTDRLKGDIRCYRRFRKKESEEVHKAANELWKAAHPFEMYCKAYKKEERKRKIKA